MTRAKWGPGGELLGAAGRRRREVGASAVEFALVAPLLFMLVFGIIEFGTVMAQKATVASAAREGARYGSVNLYATATGSPRDCADVIAEARANATTLAMTPAAVAVTVKRGSTSGSAVTRCSAAANAVPSGVALTEPPCDGSSATDNLYVVTSFGTQIDIPLLTSNVVTLQTTGASRCEYN